MTMKIRKNGKVINLTESDLRKIIKRVISEQQLSDQTKIVYYNKCEGGRGEIDPKSFEFIGKNDGGEDIIKFIKEPDNNYNGGDSASIGTCLGEDIPLTGRCFNIIKYSDTEHVAVYEYDCETKKSKW